MTKDYTAITPQSDLILKDLNTFTLSLLILLCKRQKQGNLMLDEVQQLNGVGHPQHQRLQTWD